MQRLLRFTLDLFEREPTPVVPTPPAAPASAVAALPEAPPVFAKPPALPPQTLEQALAPATFRHPQATREILLEGCLVAYAFRRGKRRTIGFSVGPDGLTVSAPGWAPLRDVDTALREKSDWIVRKLGEMRERGERMETARIVWHDGTVLPFLGEPLRVVLDPGHHFAAAGAQLVPSAGESGDGNSGTGTGTGAGQTLQVALPLAATPEQIRDVVQAWLMRQAKALFTQRLNHFAPQLKVHWQRMSLSNAGTRWGSASADGSIRLNWRLIHVRPAVIDYVVVHELSHLRVMDHSPRFWDTVGTVMPDYAALRGQLKGDVVPRWD